MADQKEGKKDDVKLIEKALKLGLGFLSASEEKLEDIADDLVRRGEEYASKPDSPVAKLLDSFADTGETVKEKSGEWKDKGAEIAEKVAGEVKSAIQKVNFATKTELEELRKEVEELKKEVKKKKAKKKEKI